jgi:hypothetical protein
VGNGYRVEASVVGSWEEPWNDGWRNEVLVLMRTGECARFGCCHRSMSRYSKRVGELERDVTGGSFVKSSVRRKVGE